MQYTVQQFYICLSTFILGEVNPVLVEVLVDPAMSICLSIYFSIYLSIYLSICLSIYLSIFQLTSKLFLGIRRERDIDLKPN